MFAHLSIRQRILFTLIFISLTGSLLQLWIAGTQLQQASFEFFKHNLETRALSSVGVLSGSLEHLLEGESGTSANALLDSLRHGAPVNYVLTDSQLSVLAFAGEDPGQRRLAYTSEIVSASRENVGSEIRGDTVFVAAPILQEGQPVGFLVISTSMGPAYDEAQRHWLELLTSTVPVLLIGVAASLWVARTISNPIQSIRQSALRMAAGALDTRIQLASRDELGELARAFNFMAGSLEDLIRSQYNFVSNAAHELRTPLMNLKLRVEALSGQSLTDSQRADYLAEINREIEHMAHLVTSLLTLARLDEGRHDSGGIIEDPVAMLQDISRQWRIQARHAGLSFQADIPDSLPDVPVTPGDLRIIVDNLLSNAVKYTTQGEIRLAVLPEPHQLVIRVSDSGLGFSAEDQKRLFERFFRADTSRQIAGTGLGLAIVQHVLRVYGGAVRAESPGPGLGATFEARIPLRPAASPSRRVAQEHSAGVS